MMEARLGNTLQVPVLRILVQDDEAHINNASTSGYSGPSQTDPDG